VSRSAYASWLWILAALFAVRVVAQPLAAVLPPGFLPPFETWAAGGLPYPVLLASQILILGWLSMTAWRVSSGHVVSRPQVGRVMLPLATVYLVGSVARLVLGATLLGHIGWFASPIPTVFHVVLATYLLVYGRLHTQGTVHRRMSR